MDISEIRRLNLAKLIEEMFAGNKSAFARAIHRAAPSVHRWLNRNSKQYRGLDERTARDIEMKLGIAHRALDLTALSSSSTIGEIIEDLKSNGVQEVEIAAALQGMLGIARAARRSQSID